MVNRNVVVGVVILLVVVLGLMFISNMTGNVITGSTAVEEVVENDLFRINEVDETPEEELNESQNSSGSG